MPETWTGKTKGGLLGYKIFVFLIKKLGLNSAYFLLIFISFWFALFSRKGSKAQYYLFRKRLKYNFIKSLISVYKNNYILGQILIDKFAILSGFKDKYTTEHTNPDVIKKMITDKTGGILVNAHIGSWEVAGQLLDKFGGKISLVMFDGEHKKIKNYLSSEREKTNIEIISIKENGSHILKIADKLKNKEIIVIHGDRYTEGIDTFKHYLLGEKAKFSSGPFHLAAKFGVPISFTTAFRKRKKHYHFYAMKPIFIDYPKNIQERKEEIFNKSKLYIAELEKVIKKYPLQWFNYFQFWDV